MAGARPTTPYLETLSSELLLGARLVTWSRRCTGSFFWLLIAACEWSDPPCLGGAGTLRSGLSCEEAAPVLQYMERVASRPLTDGQRRSLWSALDAADPGDLRAHVEITRAWTTRAATLDAWTAAVDRSHAAWANEKGDGALAGEGWLRARDTMSDAAAIWASEDTSQLALTEMDIEGWIRLASLCREVQGGSTLRISIAARVDVYQAIRDRFLHASDEERRAMLAVGPYWTQIRNVWKVSSAERQQAWIQSAPLPPPMTADSVGYLKTVIGGDVQALVRSVHEHFGPFRLD